jgi:2,4-dienoyl-CoA reductase-like NADH-dependent reductase (Old Yellow Enzyme family)
MTSRRVYDEPVLDHVFEPIRLGSCLVPNRIARTAHVTGLASMSEAFIAYHEARARGGVGLTILEIASVHPTSPAAITLWHDDAIDAYGPLVERIHAHGGRIFQQLWHGGHHYLPADGGPPWSASQVPSVELGLQPRVMGQAEIDEIVAAFARAAWRCREGGVDGVQIHAAHGYLVAQFLSPVTNRRTDEYGGSFDGRMRFALEVLGAVREAVGSDYPVSVRLSAEDGVAGGLDVETTIRIARALEATGQVDLFDVSLASYLAFPKVIGAMHEPHAYQLPLSGQVTSVLSVPTLVTGRFTSLEEAEEVIASGRADMVSMVRATLADPDLVNKTSQGHPEQVRPCIGCNQGCVGGLRGLPGYVGCIGNARAGNEASIPELSTASVACRVMVIGAGPAGLEAARVAALRGHQVVLCEKSDATGGQLRIARRAPHREEIGRIGDWLEAEVRRLGVEVRLGTEVDARLIEAERPDAVVIATGSRPRLDGLQTARPGARIEGFEAARVCSSREVLSGDVEVPASALVLDDLGHYEAIGVTEYLLRAGCAVTLASRFESLCPLLDTTLQTEVLLERLALEPRYTFVARGVLVRVDGETAVLASLDGGPERTVAAELVVLVAPAFPEDSLVADLADADCTVHLIGDARGPRYLQAAIHEGYHEACRISGRENA